MKIDQNARDDAIVLAALPGTFDGIVLAFMQEGISLPKWRAINAIHRLKRAGKVRYVRETKRWERVR